MMKQTNLLLLLLSMVWIQGCFVEGYLHFVFDRKVKESNGRDERLLQDSEYERCTPWEYIDVNDVYAHGLSLVDPSVTAADAPVAFENNNNELLQLEEENCSGDNGQGQEHRNWGQGRLRNGAPTDGMRCPNDPRRRELALSSMSQDQDQDHRALSCPTDCLGLWNWWQYPWCDGCIRRRNLRQQRQLTRDVMQDTVNSMYKLCLVKTIGCIDCSTAQVCDGDICVQPSCHSDKSCEA